MRCLSRTLEQFKQIRSSVSPEVQAELYGLVIQDLDAAVERMIGIASENGVSFTADEVRSYLCNGSGKRMKEESEEVESEKEERVKLGEGTTLAAKASEKRDIKLGEVGA